MGATRTSRGRLGDWVLVQARAARFNLIEAARLLQRRKRSGQSAPLTERSALSYYLVGEILRALVEAEGDAANAARAVAGCDDLVDRIAPRVNKIVEVLRGVRGEANLKTSFAKLPAGYEEILLHAQRAVTHR